MVVYVADVLRGMAAGETKELRSEKSQAVVVKFGEDEFRVGSGLPTSFPNTVRLLRAVGLEDIEVGVPT